MPRVAPCIVQEWSELPLMCTAVDIMRLGFGENEARAMMKREDFPSVDYGMGRRVERYALKRYLQKGVRKDA